MEESQGALNFRRANVEICKQLRMALPMMGVNLVQFAVQLISIIFVGHLGELELSGASIATSLCTVTGNSVMVGLACALETLCGQAYGAKQHAQLGIYTQRAILVLGLFSIPISVMWFNMEHVLLLFHQAPEISSKAATYARWLIPGLFAYVLLQPLVKFLQAQSSVFPMFLSSTFSMLLHIFICETLIHKLGLGFIGAAISASISYWVNVLCLVLVVLCTPRCKQCWEGLSLKMFQDIVPFVKLAVSSALMLCLEWWAFEIVLLLSGVLPRPELETSVFAIIANMIQLCYMFPFGISAAASTRVSNELGAGRPSAARFAFLVALCLAAVDAILVSSTLMLSRNYVGKIFSNEQEVISYVSKLVPKLAILAVVDAFGGTLSGVSRGCGWQTIAAAANLGAFYIVGVPVGYILAFVCGFKGEGLLIGIVSGVSIQVICLLGVTLCINWLNEAEKAKMRTEVHQPLLV